MPEPPELGDGPGPRPADRESLAAAALARAKMLAAARGAGQLPVPQARRDRRGEPTGPAAGRRRERREDPAPLSTAIDALVTETGWDVPVATGSVFARWAQIVGPDLAAHTVPDHLADGELVVAADSTAWATQLRLLAADLIRRLNAELGDGSVRRVKVRGPAGPERHPGQWRVRGSRGPRDTYG
jgi:predicted nucleic acid-binding Zn ribbon protein